VTPNRNAETVLSVFERAGYARIEPPILQPADIFLDLSGEEIRHRLFVTSDNEGREWALRPEFTIPVALAYLASPQAGKAMNFSYSGPIFRVRQGETDQFVQSGIESFGRMDREATDAEILTRAYEAVVETGETKLDIKLGDMGLFSAFLSALGLQPVWQRRLKRAFAKGALDGAALASMADTVPETMKHAGLLNALEGQDPKAARAFVEDLLQIAAFRLLVDGVLVKLPIAFWGKPQTRAKALYQAMPDGCLSIIPPLRVTLILPLQRCARWRMMPSLMWMPRLMRLIRAPDLLPRGVYRLTRSSIRHGLVVTLIIIPVRSSSFAVRVMRPVVHWWVAGAMIGCCRRLALLRLCLRLGARCLLTGSQEVRHERSIDPKPLGDCGTFKRPFTRKRVQLFCPCRFAVDAIARCA